MCRQGHGHLIVGACGSLGADGEVRGGPMLQSASHYSSGVCVCVCAELTSSQQGTGLQPYASASALPPEEPVLSM